MPPKTILLADMPAQLRDILTRALADHPELPVVVPDHAEGGVIAAVVEAKAQVVVVASGDPADLKAVDPALGWAANLSILAISSDGASACIHRMRCETQVVNGLTPQTIAAALLGLANAKPR